LLIFAPQVSAETKRRLLAFYRPHNAWLARLFPDQVRVSSVLIMKYSATIAGDCDLHTPPLRQPDTMIRSNLIAIEGRIQIFFFFDIKGIGWSGVVLARVALAESAAGRVGPVGEPGVSILDSVHVD
jgi:hypothetical protein